MDLYRSGDHYVLHADLPGVDPESVDVSVDGGILTVTARRSERTEHDVQWLTSERFTGGYMRRLSLGQDIDADHIAATYQNGVLTVTLPVAERANPRRIQVTPGARLIEPSDSPDQHTTTFDLSSASADTSAASTLSASWRGNRGCCAKYTSPIAPDPNRRRIP